MTLREGLCHSQTEKGSSCWRHMSLSHFSPPPRRPDCFWKIYCPQKPLLLYPINLFVWRIKGDGLRAKEKQLSLLHHLSLSPPSPSLPLCSGTRFVAIIEDNLQYNLVCSFLKWSDNISSDHEWKGKRGRTGEPGDAKKKREEEESNGGGGKE